MSGSDSFHVLLVNPPVCSPAAPPWGPAQAAGHLEGPGLRAETYDANLDFFLNFCLSPERLTLLRGRVEARKKGGAFGALPSDAAALLSDLSDDPEKWDLKIRGAKKTLDLMRTDAFYRPEACLRVMEDIHDLLTLISLAYFPCCVRWGGFSCPTVKDWSEAGSFAADRDHNPFLPLCREALLRRLERADLKCVVLFVSGPEQILATLTMARFIRERYPGLHLALAGHREGYAGAAEYVDTVLPEREMKPLGDLIARLGGRPGTLARRDPDFRGMPLAAYLSPALVLPVEGTDGLSAAFLEKQARRHGATGFLCKDHGVSPALLADPAGGVPEGDRPFCLALSCRLDPSAISGEPATLQRTGLKLIRWQEPGGPFEALTKTLWDVSRAGIWNHIEVPPGTGEEMSRDLVHFAASNPNIVHSWIRLRSPRSPFHPPAGEEENGSTVYSHVVKLPGRPFWRLLDDPVHLLLYVNRHGPEKLLRLRVRDDLNSVYSLGENMAYHFVPPQDLPEGYLDEICRMVEAGGSVESKWVRYNLERAFLIAYVVEEGVIVANSSLKRPRQEYVEAVNRRCGLDLREYLERGYTSVRPEYRGMGIGTKLLEGLTARVGDRKIFAIISEDNVATQKIALRNRTRRVAVFHSERTGKKIGIWIPEWMIEG